MKKNLWLILGLTLTSGLLAQQVTNPPSAGPIGAPADTNTAVAPSAAAPAPSAAAEKKAPKKASAKKAKTAKKSAGEAAALRTTPLVPGVATVVASNVNVRGQAKLRSEVITRVTKGQDVTVLEEIVLNSSADDEPSAWAKIVLPAGTAAWVHSSFISNSVVVPTRLNLRSGPGENYSVIGRLERGATVKVLDTKETWSKIEAPGDAYGFVAAQYLRQEAAPVIAAVTPPTKESAPAAETNAAPTIPDTPATAEQVAEGQTVAPPPADTPTPAVVAAASTNSSTPPIEATQTNLTAEATQTNAVIEEIIEEPPPKRIVQREGVVRGTTSIQAPTHFALVSPITGKLVNYLYSSSPSLDLRRYKGLRIVVTGEEALEERWGNTPVITIQKLEVLDE